MTLKEKLKRTNVMENIAKATNLDSSLIKAVQDLACGKAMQVKVNKLVECPFPHFESYDDNKFKSLKDSIQNLGVQNPIRVWHKLDDDSWIILSGHHRVKACKELGIVSIPAVVSDNLTLAEAKLIVNDTNNQRSWDEASLYDKCQSIMQVVEASRELYENGKLKKYLDVSKKEKFDSTDEACGYFGLNRPQIYLYLNIGKTFKKSFYQLYPKHFSLDAARYMCELDKNELNQIMQFLEENAKNNNIIKINKAKAKEIVAMSKKDEPIENIKNFMLGKEIKKKVENNFTIDFSSDNFKKYKDKIASYSKEEIESLILNAFKERFD